MVSHNDDVNYYDEFFAIPPQLRISFGHIKFFLSHIALLHCHTDILTDNPGADLEGDARGSRPLFALICKTKNICDPWFGLIIYTMCAPRLNYFWTRACNPIIFLSQRHSLCHSEMRLPIL